MIISEISSIIYNWAVDKRRIKRIWIYGSRVKGCFKDDSDLDIAVQIESRPLVTDFDIYTSEGNEWEPN